MKTDFLYTYVIHAAEHSQREAFCDFEGFVSEYDLCGLAVSQPCSEQNRSLLES